jgi:uncharacterized protein YpiB (UPF0302 family)
MNQSMSNDPCFFFFFKKEILLMNPSQSFKDSIKHYGRQIFLAGQV